MVFVLLESYVVNVCTMLIVMLCIICKFVYTGWIEIYQESIIERRVSNFYMHYQKVH